MKLACSTFWWKDQDLRPNDFQSLSDSGVEAIEVSDYHPNFNYFRARWLKEMGKAARDSGLTIATVHTHMTWHDPELRITHTDSIRRRRAIESYLRAVDSLNLLGAEILLTHDLDLWEGGPGGSARPEILENARESMMEIAEYASGANIEIVVENKPSGWSSDLARLSRFVQDLGHESVGICFDTAHAYYPYSDLVEALTYAGQRVHVLHINDATRERSHLLPGRGEIDWKALVTSISKLVPDAHFVYELRDPRDLGALTPNFEWIRSLIAGT